MHRREFLVSSMALLGTTSTAGWALAAAAKTKTRPLGVQLYTVRDQAAKDLPGVLTAIRRIGYDEVETYWDVYTRPATELKRLISDHGLRVPSGHFNYEGLESKLDYAAALGVEFMICPILPEQGWLLLDTYKAAADQFNRWGEQAKKRGMRFGFHNHNYEFRSFPDSAKGTTTGFDTLMSRTDPSLVCLEMDCYWMTQAGRDPLHMFKALGHRIELLHLKDRKPGFPPSQELNDAAEHFTPVGTGTIDWKSILAAAKSNRVRHMFVEQDSGGVPLENISTSYKTLEAIL
jgi:sugar phosphate isomerase/epimerase